MICLRFHETPSGLVTLEGWPDGHLAPPDTVVWTTPNGTQHAVKCLYNQIGRRHAWLYVVDDSTGPRPEVE